MEKERWKKIERLFEQAVDLAGADRERFLAEACPDDEELKREILEMLKADRRTDDFIESPAFESGGFAELLPTIEDQFAPEMIGQRVGAYKLVRELGRGGMGAVFLACRADKEFEKQVAVKLIKRGMDTDFILRRFRNERQILATLDHPNIARLLDGGTTDDGLPYFVMEYVEGEPINRYCDLNKLTIRERLALFQEVCAAVHYAHQNLIIHRDLKPGNILVSKDRKLKLLDFGIAKILDPSISGNSVAQTLTGMRLMTPEYASPEQVRGEKLTPASDIYALGILLCEILTGRRPYRFPSKAPHEIARVICEESPLSLLSILEGLAAGESFDSIENLSEKRGTTPDVLRREFEGEVQNIAFKSLRKYPLNRYATARDLSNDIGAFLDGKPVSASLFVSDDDRGPEHLPKAGRTLAVLPFETITIGGSNGSHDTWDFLSLGLADALITRLSNLKTVAVRPTGSILRYSHKERLDPEAAARDLNADYVLDGRIQQIDNRVRVTAQLIKIEDDETVWAGHFEEQSDDILSLQDSISAQVSEALVETLAGIDTGPVAVRGTANTKAHEAYLRGRYHWHSYTADGLGKALVYFYEAIAHDPNFARAYSGVADYYNFLSIFSIMPPNESFPAAQEAASKAIELNPDLAEAHVSLGITAFGYEWDFEASERHLRRAIELCPNFGDAHLWYAQILGLTGRHGDAIGEMKIAERLSPLSPPVLVTSAFTYRNAREFEKSLEKLRQALRIQPNYYIAQQAYSWNVKFLKNYDETLRVCEEAVTNTDRMSLPLCAYGYSLAISGKREEAREIVGELNQLGERQYIPPVMIALVHVALGEVDTAFEFLFRGLEVRDFWSAWAPIDPRFDSLKGDPRFFEFVSRIRSGNEIPDVHQSRIPTKIMDAAPVPFLEAQTAALPSWKRRGFAAIASVLAVVVAAFIGWKAVFPETSEDILDGREKAHSAPENQPVRKAIAVLPFITDGHIDGEDSLGLGLAESLYRRLGTIKELSVRPALLNLAETKTPKELGATFGVAYILRGSLEKTEKAFLVNAELVDTKTEKIVWAERFDEEISDFPTLQFQISNKVLNALMVQITAFEKARLNKTQTEDSEAYQLYLVGRYLMRNRSVENLKKAITSFERARDKDPEFALAYVGLADSQSLLNLYQIPPPADAYSKAKANAEKALALDDGLAEAHASYAYVLFYGDWNRTLAEKHFRRAIELNPSYSTAHHWFALALSAMGRAHEAIREVNKAVELEPQSPIVHSAAGLVYYYARKYDEALEMCRKSLQIDEGFVPAHKTSRIIFEAVGKPQMAAGAYMKERTFVGNTDEDHPGWSMITAQVAAVAGDRTKALAALKRSLSSRQITGNPKGYSYEIALAYALLHDEKNSLLWLARAKAVKDHSFNFVLVDPRLDSVRRSEGFRTLVRSTFE